MKMCCEREGMGRECNWGQKDQDEKEVGGKDKSWFGQKADMGKCKPGCTCPMCTKKGAELSEPDKGKCPMKGKKEVSPEKN